MKMSELKKRPDYSFRADPAYLQILRSGVFPDFTEYDAENGRFEKAVAMLEIGYLDIEMNVSTESSEDGSGYLNKAYPSYFLCAKGDPGPGASDDWKWAEIGYLDDLGYDTEVDWNAENWEKLLEKDMLRKMCAFAKKCGLSFDEPNWTGEENRSYWFDKLFGPSGATS